VCDNYRPHKRAEVVDWCSANEVELVFTPSNASWLNWIECEFTALRYFTLDGSDYPSHITQEPRSPATSDGETSTPNPNDTSPSKIRRPDYPPNCDSWSG